MHYFNAAFTGLFDLLFRPFSGLAPLWALLVYSVLAGVGMLWVYGKVSNQEAIRVIRDRVRGNLIAVRLFGDDLGLLFRLQGRLLRDNIVFLKYALVPIVVLIVPFLVIVAQLNLRYGAAPVEPGEAVLVKVTLRDAAAIDRGVTLEAPAGVVVESPGVRVESLRQVAWRVRAETAGDHRLEVRAGDETVEKELRVNGGWGAVPARRTGKGLVDSLLYPGEPPIRSETVESIEVAYRPLTLRLFGFSIHWLFFFLVISIASGFAFRGVLGVEI